MDLKRFLWDTEEFVSALPLCRARSAKKPIDT